jgi:hypothetical protein
MWGCYTHSYVAFALFQAPRGTVLTAASPDELAAKMRREERTAGARVPQPSPPQDTPGAQAWPGPGAQDWSGPGARDWPGHRSLPGTG